MEESQDMNLYQISKCEVGQEYRRTVYQNYHSGTDDEMLSSQPCILFHLIGTPREECLVQKRTQLNRDLPVMVKARHIHFIPSSVLFSSLQNSMRITNIHTDCWRASSTILDILHSVPSSITMLNRKPFAYTDSAVVG